MSKAAAWFANKSTATQLFGAVKANQANYPLPGSGSSPARLTTPYFPLALFGDYWVAAANPDGESEYHLDESPPTSRRRS